MSESESKEPLYEGISDLKIAGLTDMPGEKRHVQIKFTSVVDCKHPCCVERENIEVVVTLKMVSRESASKFIGHLANAAANVWD